MSAARVRPQGGMHVHRRAEGRKTPAPKSTYSPRRSGNTRKILVSELSGASNIAAKPARSSEIEHDKALLRRVRRKLGSEHAGLQFEAAEAAFELLLRKERSGV